MRNLSTTPTNVLAKGQARIFKVNPVKLFFGLLFVLIASKANAQLTATGQFRTRTELRSGQNTLSPENSVPALFTSQRTRLNIGYTGYRFKFFTAIQDVRVWGQDVSSINRTTTDANDGVMLHEAWGEVILNDTVSKIQNFSLKAGRQSIAYDDQKILGGLDWLQQGRRHDAAIFKFSNKGYTLDAGFAYNQNKEQGINTVYNGTTAAASVPAPAAYPAGYAVGTNAIGNMYKSFQFLYAAKKFHFGDISLLFFNDNFSQYTTQMLGTKVYERDVWSRKTYGIYWNTNVTRKFNLTGNLYGQGGHDKDGKKINAYLASLTATYQVGRKLFIGPGIDYLSGEDGTKTNTKNYTFDPLYGTPHKFWGYMDYFYVASPFGKNGLMNYFFKIKYNAKDNLSFTCDIHGFQSANKVTNGIKDANGNLGTRTPYLGTEIDLVVKYGLTKTVNIEAGYSFMQATNTMASAQVKGNGTTIANPELSNHWAYVMLNITPNFLNKK